MHFPLRINTEVVVFNKERKKTYRVIKLRSFLRLISVAVGRPQGDNKKRVDLSNPQRGNVYTINFSVSPWWRPRYKLLPTYVNELTKFKNRIANHNNTLHVTAWNWNETCLVIKLEGYRPLFNLPTRTLQAHSREKKNKIKKFILTWRLWRKYRVGAGW